MRRNNKQLTTYFILFSLLLIGVVYAILQANLQINGTARIKANTWDIHFDNIQVNENSVSIGTGDSAATIDPENNCKVDFEVTLSIPGDFYEFTIDVVNAGTIDGMIGELNKTLKVNNEVVSETPDYLDYSVTYSDKVEIEQNHKINAGTTETYLVRLEFKTDIEELPQAATITTSLEPQYLQADSTATSILHIYKLYDVFKTEVLEESGLVLEFSGEHKDSFTATGTEKIYHWYASNNDNANIILDKWNVIFAGFCWQMFRTTDTGGVKLIYNGIPSNGKCRANNYDTSIATSKFNANGNSLAYVGYMYNPNTLVEYSGTITPTEGILFGEGVTYDSTNHLYTLTNTSTSINNSHHYTCNNETGTCSTVQYYFYQHGSSATYYYYLEINDGRDISQILSDMINADDVNQTNSTIKTTIDTWYQNNMTYYTSKLEDTIFCNDRSISDIGGWKPNGGTITNVLEFQSGKYGNNSKLFCPNITDQFSTSNSKAQLTYPVGLMTVKEARLINNDILRNVSNYYWLGSPCYVFNGSNMSDIDNRGSTDHYGAGSTLLVRPVVSLKPGTKYRYGDGSKDNPFIIE